MYFYIGILTAFKNPPGPGQYLESNKLCTIGEKQTFSFPKNERFSNEDKSPNLGPGVYKTEQKEEFSQKYKLKNSSIFVSKTKRSFENYEKPDIPETYDINCGVFFNF